MERLLSSVLGWDATNSADKLSDSSRESEKLKSGSKKPKDLIFIDEGYAEAFRWNFGVGIQACDMNHVILPFSACSNRLEVNDNRYISSNTIRDFRPDRVVLFVSTFLVDSLIQINTAIATTGCADITIVTVNAPDMCKLEGSNADHSSADREEDYHIVKDSLSPVRVKVIHFPLHIVRLLANQEEPNRNNLLFVLSSPTCRSMFPVKLSAVVDHAKDPRRQELNSIADVTAADIAPDVSHQLKLLSRELAAAMAHNLGLDPTGNIFAFGKTSSLVGFSLQTYLASEIEQLNKLSPSVRQLIRRQQGIRGAFNELESASLLLIDRTQDLVTPMRHVNDTTSSSSVDVSGGSSVQLNTKTSLGHRILSTLRANSQRTAACDITTLSRGEGCLIGMNLNSKQAGSEVVDDSVKSQLGESQAQLDRLSSAMSGLASLPYSCQPSLCLSPTLLVSHQRPSPTNMSLAALQHSLLSCPEEHTRTALCECLRSLITTHGGTLPPAKKRGLGAEVLAHLQALMQAPGQEINVSSRIRRLIALNGCNLPLCLKLDNVLAVCAAVVDSMQRSNGKQLAQVCPWMCSYDSRAVRESAVFELLLPRGQPVSSAAVAAVKILQSYLRPGGSASGAVDCAHIMLMLAGVVSEVGWVNVDLQELRTLLTLMKGFLMNSSSDAELLYLAEIGLLSRELVIDILQCRKMMLTDTTFDANIDDVDTLKLRIDLELDDRLQTALMDNLKDLSLSKVLITPVAGGASSISKGSVGVPLFSPSSSSSSSSSLANSSLTTPSEAQDYITNHMTAWISPTVEGSASAMGNVTGVLSRTVECLLKHKTLKQATGHMNQASPLYRGQDSNDVSSRSTNVMNSARYMSCFEHIETPIQQLKRAGLGLLSQGLGRLGLGGGSGINININVAARPHPAAQRVVVVFVIGGISLKEVAEIQAVIESASSNDMSQSQGQGQGEGVQILLGSTCLTSPDLVFRQIFTNTNS